MNKIDYISKIKDTPINDLKKEDPKWLKSLFATPQFNDPNWLVSHSNLTNKAISLIPPNKMNAKYANNIFNTLQAAHFNLKNCLRKDVLTNQVERVKKFLEMGLSVNSKKKDRTLLFAAAQLGHFEIVKLLIEKGAKLNQRNDSKKDTALHCAINHAHFDIALLLIQKGAKVNIYNKYLLSPLHYACFSDQVDLVQALIDHGARTDVKDFEGRTPYIIAHFSGSKAIQKILPRDFFSEELLKRTTIAHVNGLSRTTKIEHKRINLNGADSPYFREKIAHYLETFRFPHLNDAHKKTLIQAFKKASVLQDPKNLLKDILSDELTIIPTGWEGHAIDLVFYSPYLAICNGGQGLKEEGADTITAFQVNLNLLCLNDLIEIQNWADQPFNEACHYFYHLLPEKLKGRKDVICASLEEISFDPSESGTCSFEAGKIACLAGATLLELKKHFPASLKDRPIFQQEAQKIKKQTEEWLAFSRAKATNDYLDSTTEPDKGLIQAVTEKICKSPTKRQAQTVEERKLLLKRVKLF